MNYFENWEEFNAQNATVPFFKTSENGVNFIGFDTSKTGCPEPMINALAALNLVKDENTKVVMINMHFPKGLIPKIEDKFDVESSDLDDGNVKVIFSLKKGEQAQNYDTNVTCHG